MKFLFDTDHASFLQKRSGKEYGAIRARMNQHHAADFALCIISFHEQTLGGHNLINRARTAADVVRGYALLDSVHRGFQIAPVLSFDTAAAAIFDNLRAQRIRVGTLDMRIAAIALSRNLVVLTRNIRDFRRVPGVLTEDWTT